MWKTISLIVAAVLLSACQSTSDPRVSLVSQSQTADLPRGMQTGCFSPNRQDQKTRAPTKVRDQ